MAVNTDPIFSIKGDTSTNGTTGMPQLVLNAAPDYTGIDADYALVHTAGASGSFVQRLRFKAGGTNTATVARIFLNNGSAVGTATNNSFYGEVSLPATTAINTAATIDVDYPMNFALLPGFKIYVGYATATAAGWACTAIAGQYA
jgi:hypothetical protein